jgi:hypothetical protein
MPGAKNLSAVILVVLSLSYNTQIRYLQPRRRK